MKKFVSEIKLDHSHAKNKVLAAPIWVRTKGWGRLRMKHGLAAHERLSFEVPKNFQTDGKSTSLIVDTIAFMWIVLLIFTISTQDFLYISPFLFALFGLFTVYMIVEMHPLRWWSLLASIAHDWCWRENYVKLYVYDKDESKNVRLIGKEQITYKEGNDLMLEKMGAFFAPIILKYSIYYTLEIVRKMQGRA